MPSSRSIRNPRVERLVKQLEPYRELILLLNSVLLWDKPWHSTAILTGTSIVFAMIKFCNPNVIALVAFMGIIATLLELFLSPLLSFLFKRQLWTSQKQSQFRSICNNWVLCKVNTEMFTTYYNRMRFTNPKIYFPITLFILSILTWVGGTVDNISLTYVVTTFLLMMPGMRRHGWFSFIFRPLSLYLDLLMTLM